MNIFNSYQNTEPKFRTITTLIMPLVMVSVIMAEWSGSYISYVISALLILLYLSMSLNDLSLSRKLFIALGSILTVVSILVLPDWTKVSRESLTKSTFVATFFLSLCCLRKAASSSPAMEKCGRYLAEQKT